ncbi:MAG: prepilin-type N-terminal cleavage/methylation domain-containing protein [Nitrospiraceae bacterium]|nr:prepilin-type N-terminal cleavage/methylation domain-containing protein [Nitrospiraceae bacterium]
MSGRQSQGGFTLPEIIAAMAILGTALLILMDAHYGALRLFADTSDEILMQSLLERAMGEAEMEVVAGKLEGSDNFGKRYPDYAFSFAAQQMGADEAAGAVESPLYGLSVTVTGPDGNVRTMEMLVFSPAS